MLDSSPERMKMIEVAQIDPLESQRSNQSDIIGQEEERMVMRSIKVEFNKERPKT